MFLKTSIFVLALALTPLAAHACSTANKDRLNPDECMDTNQIWSRPTWGPPGYGSAMGTYVLSIDNGDLTYGFYINPLEIDNSADIPAGGPSVVVWHTGTSSGQLLINQSIALPGEMLLDNSDQTVNYWASGTTIYCSTFLIEPDGALLISSCDGSQIEAVYYAGYDGAW